MAKFNDKQKLFIEFYLKHLNKSRAAIQAGYTTEANGQAGYTVYNTPHIKAEIERRLTESTLSELENINGIAKIAAPDNNLSQYYKEVERVQVRRGKIPLKNFIDKLELDIAIEDQTFDPFDANDYELKEHESLQKARKKKIAEYETELRFNEKAYRIGDLEPEIVKEMELDINALIENKDNVYIKKVSYNALGQMQLELYSNLDAKITLGKIHGSFKKDNEQKAINVPIMNFDPLSDVQDSNDTNDSINQKIND